LQDINFAQVFISFAVLLFSLTVHEMAHAWTADRLGDATARLLGRISLNPLVHADPLGTVLFPLVALITGAPIIGWAKPVPVMTRALHHPRRDYILVAAAGPASNLLLAFVAATVLAMLTISPQIAGETNVSVPVARILSALIRLNVLLAVFNMIPIPPLDGGNVIGGLLPRALAYRFDSLIRPYGFILLYALMLTRGLDYLIGRPSALILSLLQ
jgi:Zn-dependent protease